MKKLKLIKTASKATANVFCVLFGVVMTTSVIANANSTMVSTFLGQRAVVLHKHNALRNDIFAEFFAVGFKLFYTFEVGLMI